MEQNVVKWSRVACIVMQGREPEWFGRDGSLLAWNAMQQNVMDCWVLV